MPQNPPPVVVVQKKRGWGCWGCGCGVLLAIGVLIIALGIFLYKIAYATAKLYTSETPAAVATTDSGDAVFASAQQKVAAFQDAVEHQQPATLHLNGDEINTLIARDPAYQALHGHVHVALQDDHATIESSNQVGEMERQLFGNPSFLSDRYCNATLDVGLSFDTTSHLVTFDIRKLVLDGKEVEDAKARALGPFISGLIAPKLTADPTAHAFLMRTQKIALENSELVIETK